MPSSRSTEPGLPARAHWWAEALALAGILLVILLVAWPSLRRTDIDGLDPAHHLLDGYFFRDLVYDHPHAGLGDYVYSYYRQYPALGFIFWPPLFPFVLGLFCLVGGVHVLTARVCLLFFAAIFGTGLYAILRRRASPWLAFATVAAAVTVPGVAWSLNQIMLELPTLAMMMLAILAYQRVVDRLPGRTSLPRAFGCALALAAVVYTKQPAWFLLAAVLADFLLLHRRFVRKAEVWWIAGLTGLLLLPLALFTWKFGHADLAQSVGSNTRLIMADYTALPRWSLAAWTYYPRLAWSLLNPIVLVLALASVGLALVQKGFFREHALWFAWLVFGYLTFSFYDNRLPRHATFWWPAFVVLAGAAVGAAARRLPPRVAGLLPVLLVLWVPADLVHAWHRNYTDYRGERPAIDGLFASGSPGNVLLFGGDKQVFIALVREDDRARQVHVLRGDELLADGSADLLTLCRRYRIGTVLVELAATDMPGRHPALHALAGESFRPVEDAPFLRAGAPYHVLGFRYTGPVDARMAPVPLGSHLL